MKLEVDGEIFTVVNREAGVYDFVWDSGPNVGYGFTSSSSNGSTSSREELEASARNFLEMIDPQTGFIE